MQQGLQMLSVKITYLFIICDYVKQWLISIVKIFDLTVH